MPFADANSQLEPLLFQMKQYKNLTKSTIEILPSSGQQDYAPHNKCVFTLPYASLISLEDLALHFTFEPAGITNTSTEDLVPVRVLPPKDVASLISEIDIKINGQTIQHLTRYNDIVNLLNMFEDPKTAKKVLQGCDVEHTSYLSGGAITNESTFKYIANAHANTLPKEYVINHWYGLLGHRGDEVSSNFVDTNMLGEVSLTFTFAPASVCIRADATEANLTAINSAYTLGELATALTETNKKLSYKLSGLKMSMVRYNLPNSYGEALSSNLSGGAKYQIAFNHYEFHSQHAPQSSGSIRWNENSRDIKGLVAFFSNADRENTNIPQDISGDIKTSPYFKYANPIHKDSQFQIGSVKMPQNALNSTGCFLELTRAVAGVRGNNTEFYHKISTVENWTSASFMAYLSLEMTEGMTEVANGGKKLLSGLSSEQLPIACSYHYNNYTTGHQYSGYAWGNVNVNVMSITTRMLVIENGQNVYVSI